MVFFYEESINYSRFVIHMQFFFATAFGRFAPERNYRRGKGLFDCTYFQNYTKAIKIKKCGKK
ncbi:hypothetical protein DW270_07265 [Mediterraneibacter gnavus]|uniref:Uncharacterized protein n=1 Tax=Mediterraneibacter gnavus TaxID=33038 RepID=A0A414SJ05_MEDGN|nr:hypothetical protein DW270_07265 [Mediterraneibacter gnavus]